MKIDMLISVNIRPCSQCTSINYEMKLQDARTKCLQTMNFSTRQVNVSANRGNSTVCVFELDRLHPCSGWLVDLKWTNAKKEWNRHWDRRQKWRWTFQRSKCNIQHLKEKWEPKETEQQRKMQPCSQSVTT